LILHYAIFKHQYNQQLITRYGEIFLVALLIVGCFVTAIYSLGFIRGGIRRLHRYRHRSEVEVIEPVPSPHLARDLLFGWCSVATGSIFLLCAIVSGGIFILLVMGAYYTAGKPGDWMPTEWQKIVPSIYERGPGLDFIVYFVTVPVMLLLAIELLLGGGRKLL